MEQPLLPVGCVIMASGLARRFGSNKLLADFGGRPLLCRALDATNTPQLAARIVVTRSAEVEALCKAEGVPCLVHGLPGRNDTVRLGLDALSAAAKDLASRAKNNKLTPDEYKGSTFSVSNLGMFGIETFTPIVNQPDAAILGVCAVQDELVMDDEGNISKHQVMRLSFTYDHRLIDGAVAAKFVMALRDLLEKPMSIIL